jgi:hypothetical protein
MNGGSDGHDFTRTARQADTHTMDEEEARQLAEAEFAARVGWQPGECQVTGPVPGDVHGLTGVKRCLIFTFTPSGDLEFRNSAPLRVAVDPESGKADMLR